MSRRVDKQVTSLAVHCTDAIAFKRITYFHKFWSPYNFGMGWTSTFKGCSNKFYHEKNEIDSEVLKRPLVCLLPMFICMYLYDRVHLKFFYLQINLPALTM